VRQNGGSGKPSLISAKRGGRYATCSAAAGELTEYRFFHPIQVRYGDIDAQRHVNNAKYLSYAEQARQEYFQALGLWDGKDYDAIGIILLEVTCRFVSPITLGQAIKVGVRTTRLGNKSMDTEYSIVSAEDDQEFALGKAILVAYDYRTRRTKPIPEDWRVAIARFEGWE
jgi:acyl-CoA thioester hydrolase